MRASTTQLSTPRNGPSRTRTASRSLREVSSTRSPRSAHVERFMRPFQCVRGLSAPRAPFGCRAKSTGAGDSVRRWKRPSGEPVKASLGRARQSVLGRVRQRASRASVSCPHARRYAVLTRVGTSSSRGIVRDPFRRRSRRPCDLAASENAAPFPPVRPSLASEDTESR